MSQTTASIRYVKDKNDEVFFPVAHEKGVVDSNGTTLETKLGQKQDTLVSGESIKTINNESILGSGNITVQTSITTDATPTSGSTNPVQSGGVYTALSAREVTANKVTSLSSSSTNTEYPSAKCVYELVSALSEPFSYVIASSLPTASVSTMGVIYVITSGDTSTLHLTANNSGTYSWQTVGTMATSISTITNGEIDALFV